MSNIEKKCPKCNGPVVWRKPVAMLETRRFTCDACWAKITIENVGPLPGGEVLYFYWMP